MQSLQTIPEFGVLRSDYQDLTVHFAAHRVVLGILAVLVDHAQANSSWYTMLFSGLAHDIVMISNAFGSM